MMTREWVGSLRQNHLNIHYFGLGFIQVKVDPRQRMHFYVPGLDPITAYEDVHNHRYDFESIIIQGSLEQELFTFEADDAGRHILEDVSCEEGAEVEAAEGRFDVQMTSRHTYFPGSKYFVHHDQFHRVTPGPRGCITLIRRGAYQKPLAQVLRSAGSLKVCPFSKKIPEGELWSMIEKMVEENER